MAWSRDLVKNGSANDGLMWWDYWGAEVVDGGVDEGGKCFEMEHSYSYYMEQSLSVSRRSQKFNMSLAYLPPTDYDWAYGVEELFHKARVTVYYSLDRKEVFNIPLRQDYSNVEAWRGYKPEELGEPAQVIMDLDEWTIGPMHKVEPVWLLYDEELELLSQEVVSIKIELLWQDYTTTAMYSGYVDAISSEYFFDRGDVDELTYIPINESGTFEIPIFAGIDNAKIEDVYIVPKNDIDGSVNPVELQVVNRSSNEIVSTLTYSSDTQTYAYDVVDFGNTDAELLPGDAVSLKCVSGDLPQSTLVICWTYI